MGRLPGGGDARFKSQWINELLMPSIRKMKHVDLLNVFRYLSGSQERDEINMVDLTLEDRGREASFSSGLRRAA